MFTSNPFSELSEYIPAIAMQAYVVAMAIMVIGGTAIDTIHKKSAQWFFENDKKGKANAKKTLTSSDMRSIALKTATSEILTSSEFANPQRRTSHLFTMYGFVVFLVATAAMVFFYPTPATPTPAIWPLLWHFGALSLAFGGYWFWFFIRVDVSSEGKSWYQLERADLFILSLLTMATFGLIWSFLQSNNVAGWETLFLALFIGASTVLFSTVLWSKFAHMFFKPAAAFQKRVTKADGSRENLPELADRSNPADRDRHSMELLKDAPMDMGLGIKREEPSHY